MDPADEIVARIAVRVPHTSARYKGLAGTLVWERGHEQLEGNEGNRLKSIVELKVIYHA